MQEHAADIRGTCLEFSDREYADHFGGAAVTHCDVLDLDSANARATIIADIARPNQIPTDHYDSIICTHVLHVIADVPAALRGLHRILKPGGVLLCAVPMTSMNDERQRELWRFTRLGLETLLAAEFGPANVQARAYGNSLIAAGEMRGLIAAEFTPRELAAHDPRFAVEICARAVKGA
jgi:SAM-dependent methyltransferase